MPRERLFVDDEAPGSFLAGIIQAKGRIYIGSDKGKSPDKTRWHPSLSIELPGDPSGHWPFLSILFGTPHERRYYAKPQWRYVTQDKSVIDYILSEVLPLLYGDVQETAREMIAFCTAQSAKSQEEHATRVRELAKR